MENTQKTQEELKAEETKAKADAKVAEAKAKKEQKEVDAKAKKEDAKLLDEAKAKEIAEAEAKALKESEKELPKPILKNTLGKEVPIEDYFFKGIVPAGFEGTCGKPVDREDLIELFNKVFKPEDNILFYRQLEKEVYIVIVPIKYSTSIGDFNDSLEGDFQKHAISFLNEGMVNLDTMRQKLEKANKFLKYSDR